MNPAERDRIAAELRELATRVQTLTVAPASPFTAFQLCELGGFTGDGKRIAAAVMRGESGGYLDAVGDYWQITREREVYRGESLSSIARELRTSWQELYELNKDRIGDDPNVVAVGTVLRNPTLASNADKWGPSVGLWQIRTLRRPYDFPSREARDIELLRAPLAQALAAYKISDGGRLWSPWSVYKSGAFENYLDQDFELLVGHREAGRWNLDGAIR